MTLLSTFAFFSLFLSSLSIPSVCFLCHYAQCTLSIIVCFVSVLHLMLPYTLHSMYVHSIENMRLMLNFWFTYAIEHGDNKKNAEKHEKRRTLNRNHRKILRPNAWFVYSKTTMTMTTADRPNEEREKKKTETHSSSSSFMYYRNMYIYLTIIVCVFRRCTLNTFVLYRFVRAFFSSLFINSYNMLHRNYFLFWRSFPSPYTTEKPVHMYLL